MTKLGEPASYSCSGKAIQPFPDAPSDSRSATRSSTRPSVFSQSRIALYTGAITLCYPPLFTIKDWALNPDGKACTDFIWIWLSSKLALLGKLAEAYDYSAFSASRATLVGFPHCILEHLDYPPTFLLFTFPIGLMPYSIAFVVWMSATLLIYLAAVYTIIPRPAAVIAALAPFPVFANVLMGHNGFLTAGIMGLALVSVQRRPWLSGILIGLMTYKPQLGILFPIALIASRNWRTLFAAFAATLIFAAVATIAFGDQTWLGFIHALADRASALSDSPKHAFSWAMVSVFGVLRTRGVAAPMSWTVQIAVSLAVSMTVYALWARPFPYSLKAAALAIGSLLASPHAHGYDACILTIGVAFLIKDGLDRGFLRAERGTLLGCCMGLFLIIGPYTAIICIILLVLILRRGVRFQANSVAEPERCAEPERRAEPVDGAAVT
jgi:arabinofuranan 3-O-arabinosyltransferase